MITEEGASEGDDASNAEECKDVFDLNRSTSRGHLWLGNTLTESMRSSSTASSLDGGFSSYGTHSAYQPQVRLTSH